MTLIIYCVTAEVRAKRHKHFSSTSSIEEKLRTEFKAQADE